MTTILQKLQMQPMYHHDTQGITLYNEDCLTFLGQLCEVYPNGVFDMIFSDPPYFLSNNGITCQNGRMACVNKGTWDRSRGVRENHAFNLAWLELCQRALKRDGTIWITGTHHVIFSVGFALQTLGFKILNTIAWEKPNPPPNLSCRYFTHSTETVIWAARSEKSHHYFNYQLMRMLSGQKQMKTVWRLCPPSSTEKAHGKHPTQKPVSLVRRCVLASTRPGDIVLDPFMGSGTTGIACMLENRLFVGIERDAQWVKVAINRLQSHMKEVPCLVAV